ncbi:MAG: hypothetical protein K8R58_11855 [Bacteroidales bacterium]|nr:hypothetical protein [Bacteroidales bacterium]
MKEIIPRFEFRAFAQNFGIVEKKIREYSKVELIRESHEIYILSASNNVNNIKIRDNLMDIKVLVREKECLEQWKPLMKAEFPMQVSIISDVVFPALGVKAPEFNKTVYTLPQYLKEIIKPHHDLVSVNIFKRRFVFTVNNCITELADVYINGAFIKTSSIESSEIKDIIKTRQMLRLDEYENVNYIMVIKRIIGMEPMPNGKYF